VEVWKSLKLHSSRLLTDSLLETLLAGCHVRSWEKVRCSVRRTHRSSSWH